MLFRRITSELNPGPSKVKIGQMLKKTQPTHSDQLECAEWRPGWSLTLSWIVSGWDPPDDPAEKVRPFFLSMFRHLLVWLETHVCHFTPHYAIKEKMIVCAERCNRSLHNRQICNKYCFHYVNYGL